MNPNEILTRAADKLAACAAATGDNVWGVGLSNPCFDIVDAVWNERGELVAGPVAEADAHWIAALSPAAAPFLVALLRDVAESWPTSKREEWMNDGAKAALAFARLLLGTCGAVSDSDVRCDKPAGHEDHHKGTSTDEHGQPMFSRWSNNKTTPTSTLTGQPCTGHAADKRCIECATDTEIRAAIPQPEAAVYVHQETNHG